MGNLTINLGRVRRDLAMFGVDSEMNESRCMEDYNSVCRPDPALNEIKVSVVVEVTLKQGCQIGFF